MVASLHISLFLAALPHSDISTSLPLLCSSTPWWHHYISPSFLHLYPMVASLHLFLEVLPHGGITTYLPLPCRSTPWWHHYISSLKFYPMVALLHVSLFLVALPILGSLHLFLEVLPHGGITTYLPLPCSSTHGGITTSLP